MAPKLKVSADALRAAIEKMKIDHPTLLSIDVDTLDAAQLKAFRLFCMQGFYEKGPRQAARDARNIVDEVNEKKRLLEERIANAKQAVVPVKEQVYGFVIDYSLRTDLYRWPGTRMIWHKKILPTTPRHRVLTLMSRRSKGVPSRCAAPYEIHYRHRRHAKTSSRSRPGSHCLRLTLLARLPRRSSHLLLFDRSNHR